MDSSEFLREAIARMKGVKYNTLSELAKMANVNQGNLSSFMKPKGDPKRRETMTFDSAWKILEALEIQSIGPSIRRLFPNAPTETVKGEGLQELSVYDVAGAGPAIEVSELTPLFSVYAPPDYLRRADYAILVDGHSMEPLIPNRSVVGIKTGVPFVANELYAARIPYEGMVIKRVGVDRATNEFVFKSQNPDKESYPDFRLNINEAEEIIVGRVVWVMWGY